MPRCRDIRQFRIIILLLVVLVSTTAPAASSPLEGHLLDTNAQINSAASGPAQPLSLWYRKPASTWIEALPIGNGMLGAMVFGGVESERLALNDGALWSGAPYDGNPKHEPSLLANIRNAIFDGRYGDADKLATGFQGPWTQSFEPLGDLTMHFELGDGNRNSRVFAKWGRLQARGVHKLSRSCDGRSPLSIQARRIEFRYATRQSASSFDQCYWHKDNRVDRPGANECGARVFQPSAQSCGLRRCRAWTGHDISG